MKLLKSKKIILVYILVFLSNCLDVSMAEAFSDTAGGRLLKMALGARTLGLAETFTAVEGLDSMDFNPAALSVEGAEISTSYVKSFEDTYLGYITYGQALDQFQVAFKAATYQGGTIDIIERDGTQQNYNAEQDYMACLGFNYSLEAAPIGLVFGANLKGITSLLLEKYRALAFAVDFGIFSKNVIENLSFGLSVLNVGSKMKYLDSEDALPLETRIGFSYPVSINEGNQVLLLVDLVDAEKLSMGCEYGCYQSLFLRVGYKVNDPSEDISAGLGIRLNPVQIDYGLKIIKYLGLNHYFTMTLLL